MRLDERLSLRSVIPQSALAHDDTVALNKIRAASSVQQQPYVVLFTTVGDSIASAEQTDHLAQQKQRIQLNTLYALKHLWPRVQLVVFTKSAQVKALLAPLAPQVMTSSVYASAKNDLPILKSMWQYVGRSFVRCNWTGYINSDILVGPELIETLKTLDDAVSGQGQVRLSRRVLLVAQRFNYRIPLPFDADKSPLYFGPRPSALVESGRTKTPSPSVKSASRDAVWATIRAMANK